MIAAVSFGWSNGVVTLIHPPDGNLLSTFSAFDGSTTVKVSRRSVVSADTKSTGSTYPHLAPELASYRPTYLMPSVSPGRDVAQFRITLSPRLNSPMYRLMCSRYGAFTVTV